MASGAKRDEVVGFVGAALVARLQVMDFEETGSVAAWCLATMAIAGQDFAAGAGWDGGGVALARFTDRRVAGDAIAIGPSQGPAVGLGLAAIRALMHMDLHRGEVPPGGPFLRLDQRGQGFQ